jgi:hypothetical protein
MRFSRLWAVLLSVTSVAANAAPVQRFDAGGAGFIDDPFALRDDGKAIAFITTDGATTATLHLADVGGSEVKVAGAPTDAVALHWLAPSRVLIVAGKDGAERAQLFTPSGPDQQKLGPFGQLALATVDGKRAIVTYCRTDKKGIEHTLTAYAAENLKLLKRKSWREDAEGQLKLASTTVKPLWWDDGFTVMGALRAGEFDKARDMRRPDRYARVDAFSGKILDEKEVQDVLGFAEVGKLRRDAPKQSVLVHFSDDRHKLLVTDGISTYDVPLPRPIWKYDPDTLAWQTLDDKRVTFSLTIDPVNPDAVRRKKADIDEIDLYGLDRQTHAVHPLLRLNGEGRRTSWRIAAGRLLLLRKGKGFDRGGVALELYDVTDAARAAKP